MNSTPMSPPQGFNWNGLISLERIQLNITPIRPLLRRKLLGFRAEITYQKSNSFGSEGVAYSPDTKQLEFSGPKQRQRRHDGSMIIEVRRGR